MDWKTRAEQFATAKRHMKLSDPIAIHLGNYLGSLLWQLGEDGDIGDRRDELRQLAVAFQAACGK